MWEANEAEIRLGKRARELEADPCGCRWRGLLLVVGCTAYAALLVTGLLVMLIMFVGR